MAGKAQAVPVPVILYPAALIRMIDGDTYDLRVLTIDVGDKDLKELPVRVFKYYAKEHGTPEGDATTAAAAKLFAGAKLVTFRTRKARIYQRALGDVFIDGQSIADLLIAQGYGSRTATTDAHLQVHGEIARLARIGAIDLSLAEPPRPGFTAEQLRAKATAYAHGVRSNSGETAAMLRQAAEDAETIEALRAG